MDAVVVGSGPNGLAAAVTLAGAGLEVVVLEAQDTVGGGSRTLDLGLAPGVRHDICSAVHPMAWASPFFRSLRLDERVEVLTPEVSFAHPLDGGRAGVAYRDLDRTAEGLAADGEAWRRLFGPLSESWQDVVALALGDHRSVPDGVSGHPARAAATAARFALGVLRNGQSVVPSSLRTTEGAALLTGVAGHAITPLPSLAAAGTAVLLTTLAHAGHGWPVLRGGSQAIVDALLGDLVRLGGRVVTGHPVARRADLPPARAYLFDTGPRLVAQVFGDAMPPHLARAYAGYRYGNAAAKVDLVVDGPIPWAHPEVRRAGTVHLGGTRDQVVAAERAVARSRHAEHPLTLVSDPTVVDDSRATGGLRPVWAYAHVPAGSDVDPTEAVLRQVERFAPGFRDTVVAHHAIPAAGLAAHDANLVGGDISGGAVSLWSMATRPTPRLDPYASGAPGVYLCSASAPPGPGVHGLSGWYAARRALRQVFGRTVSR
ncbi:phytoene desaturase family protein [Cellulomonas triticagri]|uniref:Pyridine nucleotide-disulfide oxidoreductase domain-containing protein 2 n=1 Tax=Cellulomonas triticagri TaxID=2483352 RepID=A0A3M2JC47_9CELL|nr:NAD(P)/FAD-dependent oxidoreductase [Cellulomonas triticagri]RMI09083.1 NAD(P)/FAD-dependent oxidoreductase [Cellulomonas triticagri]